MNPLLILFLESSIASQEGSALRCQVEPRTAVPPVCLMRTGTSAEHLCPLLSVERQLSLEVQQIPPKIPTEGPPSTMEASIFRPQGVSGGCSSWVLRDRTSWLHCSFPTSVHRRYWVCLQTPQKTTFLLGMPAVILSWIQASLVVPKLASSEKRLMKPQFPQA